MAGRLIPERGAGLGDKLDPSDLRAPTKSLKITEMKWRCEICNVSACSIHSLTSLCVCNALGSVCCYAATESTTDRYVLRKEELEKHTPSSFQEVATSAAGSDNIA